MISIDSYKHAIDHISKYGDTDIFPHLVESVFLMQKRDDIADTLSKNNLNSFEPAHSIEALAPKSRYGFRIANQLLFLDCLIFTAAVIEIADDLEKLKLPVGDFGPFAYRYQKGDSGSLFMEGKSYRDWLALQKKIAEKLKFSSVIFTDIADFYQRIYFHRIENVLGTATSNVFSKKIIERIIKKIRARQSYGIPVGGSASRLIAETVITDVDHGLISEDFQFTRFVDDIRIYVPEGVDPYRPLCISAEMLLSEGLTLNAQKTKVLKREEYVEFLNKELEDVFDSAQNEALEILYNKLYFDESPEIDAEEIVALQTLNLKEMLDKELENDHWDFGRIKAVLRAMRLTQSTDCIEIIISNFSTLLPFIREIYYLFDSLKENKKIEQIDITDLLIENLNSGAGQSVPAIRAWLIEFFIRQITPISVGRFNTIQRISEMDGRQIILANGIFGNVVFFRKNKTRFDNYSRYEQYAFILAASCLPKDEYMTWVSAIKGSLKGLIDQEYCSWAIESHGKLKEVVNLRSKSV